MAEEAAPVDLPAMFALTPARVTNAILNYNNSGEVKIYKGAIQPLSPEFDVDAEGLNIFLAALFSKARAYGWDTILEIPKDNANPNINLLNLLTHYGEFTLPHLRTHVSSYANTQSRAAQDSVMLYECVWSTLTKIGKSKIWIWKDDFHVDSNPSGILLLKVIIRESHIDTNATVRHLREKISSLDVFIGTIGHDIEKFNAHVIHIVNGLRARGHTSSDVLANLFKAYKSVPDPEFVRYIKEKEDSYDEGTDISMENLMLRAADKYKRMAKSTEWKAPSPEHEKIIALEAALKKLTKAKPPSKPVANNNNKSPTKGKGKSSNDKKGKPSWMLKPPATGQPFTKKVDGKEYTWCTKHKSWGKHASKDCQGRGLPKGDQASKPKPDTSDKPESQPKQLSLAQAMSAIDQDEE